MAGFDGSVNCWIPDVPVAREDNVRVRVAQFGDGYQQRTLDGINAVNTKFALQWNNRQSDIIEAMVAFFVAQKGESFNYYEQQTQTMWRVVCDNWRISWDIRRRHFTGFVSTPLYYGTLSAEFVRMYGVTA
jgi:phage-related protein